jgi:hypothetical protein
MAHAEPLQPKGGNGPHPKTRIGSRQQGVDDPYQDQGKLTDKGDAEIGEAEREDLGLCPQQQE